MDAAVPPGEPSDKTASGCEGCGEGPSDRKLLPPPKCCWCVWVWAGEGSMLTGREACWALVGQSEEWEIGGA